MPYRDDDRQKLDPREFPEPDESNDGLMPCPHCFAVIFEQSECCPACGEYLSEEDAPSRKPWWIVAGILLCLAVAIYWVMAP